MARSDRVGNFSNTFVEVSRSYFGARFLVSPVMDFVGGDILCKVFLVYFRI